MRLDLHPVTFRYPGPAEGPLSIVGSFNHWDPTAHPLQHQGGEWRITVFLPAGTYPYAFVDGGRPGPDPDPARMLREPLGGHYSLLVIPGTPSPARTGEREEEGRTDPALPRRFAPAEPAGQQSPPATRGVDHP
ncbi:MAG TPA: hypothetical protein VEP50_12705 [bacterium]|nr:hypothetical protein [bacterium]